ncbi:MAG: CheR family methyltransferase [Nanobdellota archaeon]
MVEIRDPENFDKLKKLIHETLDFNCDNYSDSFIRRRTLIQLKSNGVESYTEYMHILKHEPLERERLLKQLTIHVTHFFRDRRVWEELQDEILPQIISSKKGHDNKIRIWSCGCSSGEEPISVAILLSDLLGRNIKKYDVEILASDMAASIIIQAKKGEYYPKQFKEMGVEFIDKYFDKTSEELLKVKPDILSLIKYKVSNVLTDIMPDNMDLILCRNTVIYFSTTAKVGLYQRFYKTLKKEGFLVLGATEFLQGPSQDWFEKVDVDSRIFRKP